MQISPAVDLDEVAIATDGYSGADLQALLYNAHLEAIHASLASSSGRSANIANPQQDERPVEFITFGGAGATGVVSKAEEMALQRRASPEFLDLEWIVDELLTVTPNYIIIAGI